MYRHSMENAKAVAELKIYESGIKHKKTNQFYLKLFFFFLEADSEAV